MSKKSGGGFGRPPKSTQFKKGQSGNPNGRRKGSKNFGSVFSDAINEKVTVQVNGQRKRISKMEAMAAQLANKAATGEPKASQIVLSTMSKLENTPQDPEKQEFEEADELVIKAIIERIRSMENPNV